MNILVTGGAGFIGSSLADAFLAEGREVRVLDDLPTGFADNVPPPTTSSSARWPTTQSSRRYPTAQTVTR